MNISYYILYNVNIYPSHNDKLKIIVEVIICKGLSKKFTNTYCSL
jgi:hypothetical protein